MNDTNTNQPIASKLVDLLGFDPTKNGITAEVFKEAVEDVEKERREALKAKATALVKETVQGLEDLNKLKNEFNGKTKAIEKKLQESFKKASNILKAANGEAVEEEQPEEKTETNKE